MGISAYSTDGSISDIFDIQAASRDSLKYRITVPTELAERLGLILLIPIGLKVFPCELLVRRDKWLRFRDSFMICTIHIQFG